MEVMVSAQRQPLSLDRTVEDVREVIGKFCSDAKKTVCFRVGGKGGIHFKSFNDIFESLMCAVANGHLSLKRLRKSVSCVYKEGCLKSVDNETSSWCSSTGDEKVIWNFLNHGVECSLQNRPTLKPQIPSEAPTVVRLEKTWSFVYKDELSYNLKQVFSGKSKSVAFCSSPRYFLDLELHETLKQKNTEDILTSVAFKLGDFLNEK